MPPRLSNGVLACHELSIPPRCNNQIYRSEFDITKCMVHKGTEVKPSYLIFVSLSFFLLRIANIKDLAMQGIQTPE